MRKIFSLKNLLHYFCFMIHTEKYQQQLEELISNALKEDVGDGDHSTLSIIGPDVKGKAILKIKDEGIIAGIEVAEKIFSFVEPSSVLKDIRMTVMK